MGCEIRGAGEILSIRGRTWRKDGKVPRLIRAPSGPVDRKGGREGETKKGQTYIWVIWNRKT